MKTRPILFSSPMIRAILDGRKTVTRRVVKPQPPVKDGFASNPFLWSRVESVGPWFHIMADNPNGMATYKCPYGQPGDRLWVRETWRPYVEIAKDRCGVVFAADNAKRENKAAGLFWRMGRATKWRPSIYMPRWASRLTLEIVSVRVERVQDISEADARAEGVAFNATLAAAAGGEYPNYRTGFRRLWNEINAARGFGWDANPWVWVVEFKVIPQTTN